MNILVISPIYTNPIKAGSSKCILDYCDMLTNMHNNVYLLYIGKKNGNSEKKTRDKWGDHFYYIYQNKMEYYLSRFIYHFCVKFFKCYPLDYYVIFGLRKKIRAIRKIVKCDFVIANYPWMSFVLKEFDCKLRAIFTHDCFTNKQKRIGFPMYSLSACSEEKALSRANLILSIQQNESIFFNYLVPNIPCKTVYTPMVFHKTEIHNDFNILYIAANNQLNYQGIHHFLCDIYPALLAKYSFFHLKIAGGICDLLTEFSDNEKITLLGKIDDLEDFYNSGDIVINPTEKGTGLKIKTLEAISYGKIVVSSPHSTEGLYKKDKLPLFIASNFDDYNSVILKLLSGGEGIRYEMKDLCQKYIEDLNDYIIRTYKDITTY